MSTETPFDLKKTVNLPKTNFAQKANLTQGEPARLQNGSNSTSITRSAAPVPDARSSSFTTARLRQRRYPSRHRDEKVLKDFIVKSRTMMGFDAPYVPGYDCHGFRSSNTSKKALEKKGKRRAN